MTNTPEKPVVRLADMISFMDLLCAHLGVKGDKIPAETFFSLVREDIAKVVAVRGFLRAVEPYSEQVRNLVRTKGQAIR